MPRNITVTFSDGTSHVYQNAPDDLTPDMVTARAQKDFGKSVTALDGGRKAAPAAPSEIPGARQEPGTWQKVRNVVAPTVEMLGGAGGALLGGAVGAVGGPVGVAAGTVGGAGLGYGIAKELLEQGDVLFGGKAPRTGAALVTEPVKNIVEGATWEAGGQAVPAALMKAGRAIKNMPYGRASRIAQSAAMEDMPQVISALRNAPPGATVAEVTSNIKNPAWHALVQESLERDPAGARFLSRINAMTDAEATNALTKLAGGQSAAQVRGTSEAAKKAAARVTTPMREAALGRADLGLDVSQLEGAAVTLGKASDVLETSAQFREAGRRGAAQEMKKRVAGQLPAELTATVTSKNLEPVVNEWAAKAATGSLDVADAARQSKGAADALRAVGIKPLEGDKVVANLRGILKNPEYAGNDLIEGAVRGIADDIAKWTSVEGVIPAEALDALRKNSINATIAKLRPGLDATAQRNAAAGVLSRIKPVIDDAIESAGGTGYKEYLKEHTRLSQKVAEKQLSGEALRLWKTDKDAFIRLVQNESPDVVEKILGPGKYDIAKNLADDAYTEMQKIAAKNLAQKAASEQATEGQKALTTLIRQNALKFRLPSWMSAAGAAFNKGMSELERSIGTNSMRQLSIAMQDPTKAANLLESLPPAERTRILDIIADPTRLKGAGEVFQTPARQRARQAVSAIRSGTTNALIPQDSENQNALSR